MPTAEESGAVEPIAGAELEFKQQPIIEEDPLGGIENKDDQETAGALSLRLGGEVNFITEGAERAEEKPRFIKRAKGFIVATLLAGALTGPLGGYAEAQTRRGGNRRVSAISGAITDNRRGGREENLGGTIAREVIRAGAGIYAQKEAIELSNIIQELHMVNRQIMQLENELSRMQRGPGPERSGNTRNISDAITGRRNQQDMADNENLSEAEKTAIEVQNITQDLGALYANREDLIKAARRADLKGEIAADIYYATSDYNWRR